jgi:hypothetical protein
VPKSRSDNKQDSRPKANPSSSWPTGITYEDVFDYERGLRESAEADIIDRIQRIEDRLFIVEQCPSFAEDYPELIKAYENFKNEESKMLTFEALKGNHGNNKK